MITNDEDYGTINLHKGIITKYEINNYICRNAFPGEWSSTSECPTKGDILKCKALSVSGSNASNQCVWWEDVSTVSSMTLKVRVYNKRSSGKINIEKVYVYYNTSSSAGDFSSYELGSISIGDVSNGSYKDVQVTLDLTKLDLTKQYYFKVRVGQTQLNRNWRFSDVDNYSGAPITSSDSKNGYSKAYAIQGETSLFGSAGGTSINAIYCFVED